MDTLIETIQEHFRKEEWPEVIDKSLEQLKISKEYTSSKTFHEWFEYLLGWISVGHPNNASKIKLRKHIMECCLHCGNTLDIDDYKGEYETLDDGNIHFNVSSIVCSTCDYVDEC